MKRRPDIRLKRAYEPPATEDGTRVLVHRLWPRGLRKAEAGIDRWLKDVAPSTELRRWFGHDPERWAEFSAATAPNSPPIRRCSTNCAKWPRSGRSRWSIRRATNFTTMPWCCARCSLIKHDDAGPGGFTEPLVEIVMRAVEFWAAGNGGSAPPTQR